MLWQISSVAVHSVVSQSLLLHSQRLYSQWLSSEWLNSRCTFPLPPHPPDVLLLVHALLWQVVAGCGKFGPSLVCDIYPGCGADAGDCRRRASERSERARRSLSEMPTWREMASSRRCGKLWKVVASCGKFGPSLVCDIHSGCGADAGDCRRRASERSERARRSPSGVQT